MIFLDANIFLRQLTSSNEEGVVLMEELATDLFERVERGELAVTTSEVVIHEVCFILSSPRQYGLGPADFIPDLAYLLSLSGFRFPRGDQAIYRRALDLYLERPRLGFADAVIAARCEAAGHDLATFDRHFDAIPTVPRWSWETPTA